MTTARQSSSPPPPPRKRSPKKVTQTHLMPAKPPLQTDLERAIYAMPEEFVQCRDWGHSWRPFSARWLPRENCFEQILRCGRCESERKRHLGPRGQRLDADYTYADGYLMSPGQGRMTMNDRDAVRLASIRSVLIKDLVQE